MGLGTILSKLWTAAASVLVTGGSDLPLGPIPNTGPEVFIQTVPRAPPNMDLQVFRFSIRASNKHPDEEFPPIPSPSFVSDPSEWIVSLEDQGTVIYPVDNTGIALEHKNKVLATFRVYRHGLRDLRMVVKTTVAADITCWGGGMGNPTNDHATVKVGNRNFQTAAGFLREAGISIFVVNRHDDSIQTDDPLQFGAKLPIYWTKVDGQTHHYYTGGHDLDVYVSVADPTVVGTREFTKFLWGITGIPKVPPPAYALGFMASRWGWEDRNYISKVLDTFDIYGVPIDAIIMDFEWYLNITGGDYLVPLTGLPNYPDFRLGNPKTFPDIRSQAREYRARNVKFGGIRKPRLGDQDLLSMAWAKGWLQSRGPSGKGRTRDLNFALPDVREWYANQTRMFRTRTENMPDFYWNDEGETSYFTYHHWVEAQQLASAKDDSRRRRFSLNRAFTPGCQRLESFAVWTGDVTTTWESLQQNVDMLVRWSEAGAPLVGFDIGGFVGPQPEDSYAELLVRWYQLGAFAGVMRVHSILGNKPHFPFPELWGDQAAATMKQAVALRYKLLPTIMTSMYQMMFFGIPWVERRVFDNRQALDFLFANRTIFVAPIVQPMNQTRRRYVQFPENSAWYPLFISAAPIIQTPSVTLEDIKLDDIPVFARAGSIVLLHGTDISETSRVTEIVGGRHDVIIMIFCSPDNSGVDEFTSVLSEDDGETYNPDSVRFTEFTFNQKASRLSWKPFGNSAVPRWYDEAKVVLRRPDGSEIESIISLEANVTSLTFSQKP